MEVHVPGRNSDFAWYVVRNLSFARSSLAIRNRYLNHVEAMETVVA